MLTWGAVEGEPAGPHPAKFSWGCDGPGNAGFEGESLLHLVHAGPCALGGVICSARERQLLFRVEKWRRQL